MTKKKGSHQHSQRLRPRRDDSRELAQRLAPLEELRPEESGKRSIDCSTLVVQEEGAIVVGGQKPTLPQDIVDVSSRQRFLGLEPVVIVIVGLLLAFIVFITWQVSLMPRPTN